MKKTEIKTPPDSPALTTEMLGKFLVLQGRTLPAFSNDAAVQQKIVSMLNDPARVVSILLELAGRRAHEIALGELRCEAEAAAAAEQSASRKAAIASGKRTFAASRVDSLEAVMDLLADGPGFGGLHASFCVLTNDMTGRIVFAGQSNPQKLRATAAEHRGFVSLVLEYGHFSVLRVDAGGAESFAAFSARFKIPPTLAWSTPDGATIHLFAGHVEAQGERVTRTLLPGLVLDSKSAIPLPPQKGCAWIIRPDGVAQGAAAGLPEFPNELKDLFKGLGGATSDTWGRYFKAILDVPPKA